MKKFVTASHPKPKEKTPSSSSQWTAFFALFGSLGTLVCCVLPALFVSLGAGASLVTVLGYFPQLIWFSENKELTFGVATVLVSLAAWNYWRTRNEPCPADPKLAFACRTGRNVSRWMIAVSFFVLILGALFAFLTTAIE